MSLRHRVSSRLRFEQYRRGRRTDGDSRPAPGEAPARQRSLWRLYRELYAILEGHRGSIALAMATLSVSTLLRLLLGRLAPATGRASLGASVAIGEIDQTRTGLAEGLRLGDAFEAAMPKMAPADVRTLW